MIHTLKVSCLVTNVLVSFAVGVLVVLQSVTPPPDAVLAPRRNSSVENMVTLRNIFFFFCWLLLCCPTVWDHFHACEDVVFLGIVVLVLLSSPQIVRSSRWSLLDF